VSLGGQVFRGSDGKNLLTGSNLFDQEILCRPLSNLQSIRYKTVLWQHDCTFQNGSDVEPAPAQVRRRRSMRQQALIVGGSAAAGSAIGAVAGGGKGAAVGAVSGGVAGLVYDLFTKNR
jgi:hypothetical protein